jgi:inosine-uridine nucleoside N-ribohydrolase
MPHKLLLDTDIGSDIDDAVCLAYLLAQPECDLIGITTVTGEGQRRAMMASALCKAAGKEVPIYIGAETPLIVAQRQPHTPQAAALDKWPHAAHFPTGETIEFMRHTIRAHPGEVTLLAIGPLTNVALLFAADPAIPALLKGLVLMGGSFWAGHFADQEWNLILDPHAAAIVYRAAPPVHRSIGLDVTMQVTMPAAEVRDHFQHGILRPVLDFAEVWFAERDVLTFHDPLAATTIFDSHICGFERGQVSIELSDQTALGKTYWKAGEPSSPHEVATTVDAARFFRHYFQITTGR